jgi:GAF domain-containing protein
MQRAQKEVQTLAQRIRALPLPDRAKLLARLMVDEEQKDEDWSALEAIRRRTRRVDPRVLKREIDRAVREVRRERSGRLD